jgi:hypothetical protein
MPTELANLTNSLQRHLGLQQAQTFEPRNITADAIARLVGVRADVSNLQKLWSAANEAGPELVHAWDPQHDWDCLIALRRVLDSSLVITRFRSTGVPKTFLPFSPRLINAKGVGNLYRELGRSVVEGLWARPGLSDVRKQITEQVTQWGGQHPLALLLGALCLEKALDREGDTALLATAIEGNSSLKQWMDTVVTQDWKAWVKASTAMSVDEQLETMTSLIGLHLHVALLRRLGDKSLAGHEPIEPFFFTAVEGQEREPIGGSASSACTRAAVNFFSFWRDEVNAALRMVARQAIDKALVENHELKRSVEIADWTAVRMWAGIRIEGGRKSDRATNQFHEEFQTNLEDQEKIGAAPTKDNKLKILVDALVLPFGTPSQKVKDFLRGTGYVAGIVGPQDDHSRKRYLLDERGLSLLARLHAARSPEEVFTDEEDRTSVEAFLDDIFQRYGMVITNERPRVRQRLDTGGPTLRSLELRFPTEEAIRRNRALLDQRLDALRLVRRYSDASAVIRVL